MKKTLMILGGIFAVLIIAGVVAFSILAVKGSALDDESKAYVDKVTPIILSDLNTETLFEYASDELRNSATTEEFEKVFKWFEKLGQFKSYESSSGQASIFFTPKNGKQITAKYQAEAEFETGPATVTITAIKKGDKWQLIGFHINSMALAN